MSEFSPMTQALLDAVCSNTEPDCDTQHLIATTLLAVVEHCAYNEFGDKWIVSLAELEAIAAELRGTNPANQED